VEIGSDLITAAFFLSSVSKTLFLAGGSFLAPDRKKHGDRLPLHRHWRVMVRIILTSGCAYSTSTVPDMISLEDVGPLHFSSCVDEDRFPSGLDEKNYRRTFRVVPLLYVRGSRSVGVFRREPSFQTSRTFEDEKICHWRFIGAPGRSKSRGPVFEGSDVFLFLRNDYSEKRHEKMMGARLRAGVA